MDRHEPSDHDHTGWIVAAVSAPFVYAFSIFPVAIVAKFLGWGKPPDWIFVFYAPLYKLLDWCEPARKLFQHIGQWFGI
ncbi:hypothetical protein FEM03_00580 [Phragmitibacter flavus]|uniref:Uncharacterized protein n=1 Tax=Phragmitibacter flavus TaxID=2576071 RepID=A0A5R8KKV9_9BACT|nr:hypothetical protein [Phragmitibacter flavus]TLD72605.1 hypothetical protein FEM03_00580 [Phragmitibacter flavus]